MKKISSFLALGAAIACAALGVSACSAPQSHPLPAATALPPGITATLSNQTFSVIDPSIGILTVSNTTDTPVTVADVKITNPNFLTPGIQTDLRKTVVEPGKTANIFLRLPIVNCSKDSGKQGVSQILQDTSDTKKTAHQNNTTMLSVFFALGAAEGWAQLPLNDPNAVVGSLAQNQCGV